MLPHVLARLRMESLHRFRIEMNVTVHLGGGFYKVHRDNAGKLNRSRNLSYVYYLQHEPRRFSGGDLLLYDMGFEADDDSSIVFSRIEPLDNSLVFFPSDAFHEITPSRAPHRISGTGGSP